MEIEESVLVEVSVDSHCHIVADAHNGTKGVGAQTHVGILTHYLEALTLLLHGVVIAAQTVNLETSGLNL